MPTNIYVDSAEIVALMHELAPRSGSHTGICNAAEPVAVTSRYASWPLNAADDHIGQIIRQSGRPYEEELLEALATLIRPD